jgi:hypothetical protein
LWWTSPTAGIDFDAYDAGLPVATDTHAEGPFRLHYSKDDRTGSRPFLRRICKASFIAIDDEGGPTNNEGRPVQAPRGTRRAGADSEEVEGGRDGIRECEVIHRARQICTLRTRRKLHRLGRGPRQGVSFGGDEPPRRRWHKNRASQAALSIRGCRKARDRVSS